MNPRLNTVCPVDVIVSRFAVPAPPEPLAAAVILPFESTVMFADVYEPGATAVSARVAAKLPVPLHVTSPVRVIVWSPVFVPLSVEIPSLVLIVEVVSSPVLVPEVFANFVFSASVTKFSSAPSARETTGLTTSVLSTEILAPATTEATTQVPEVPGSP